MTWTSVEDGLPDEGEECVLVCMQQDGSLVQAVGYRDNGKWIIEGQDPDPGWKIRRWMSFAPARKTG